jgi:3-polyprenyl-4-hydroxybenzoate decarboxylase
MGKPWDDWHVPGSLVQSAILKDWLEAHGVSVGSVYHHAPLTSIVIGVTPRPGLLRKITNIVMAGDRFMSIPATGIIFVEEDVDVTSLEDVWWSIQTRMHPRQFEVIDRTMYNPCMPYGTPEERERKETTRWVMNATFPTDWSAAYKAENTRVVGFNQAWSKEVQDRVLSRWSEYGFPEKKRL